MIATFGPLLHWIWLIGAVVAFVYHYRVSPPFCSTDTLFLLITCVLWPLALVVVIVECVLVNRERNR